jgi:hypothetical protein
MGRILLEAFRRDLSTRPENPSSAMTVGHTPSPSRGAFRPGFANRFAQKEGAGNAGCLLHPRSHAFAEVRMQTQKLMGYDWKIDPPLDLPFERTYQRDGKDVEARRAGSMVKLFARHEIEILSSRDRAVTERLLLATGRFHDVVANEIE